MEGLAAAKACGRVGGRKRGLSKVAKMKAATAKCLYAEGKKSIEEISEALRVSKGTVYRYLDYLKVERPVRQRFWRSEEMIDNLL